MKCAANYLLLAILCIALSSCTILDQTRVISGVSETTFYIVRHAEKELGSAPGLTELGKKRADFYVDFFDDEIITSVYSTPTRRTIETATPLAKSKNLIVTEYANGLEFDNFGKSLLASHEGKTVFIVGHSNTVPLLLNALLGKEEYTDIPHDDYNRLYQVVVDKNYKTKVRRWNLNLE